MILGTFAYCGSGQDTLAESFCRLFGYKKYCIGDVIRNIADNNRMTKERDNLRRIRQYYDEKYGRYYFPELLVRQIKSDSCKDIIITGIRTMQEYQVFTQTLNMKLIFVFANEEVRIERMLKRKDEKDEKTIQLLGEQMKKENDYFDYGMLEGVANYTFDFNMPLSEYLKKECKIVKNIISMIGG